jgi:hypothetical protein
VELAYNIVDALKKYSSNTDLSFFAAALTGSAAPAVWFDYLSLLNRLRVRLF